MPWTRPSVNFRPIRATRSCSRTRPSRCRRRWTPSIFTSDNGYFFGEHGLADKWYLYEESVRVPLIVFDPTLPKEKRDRTVDAMALNIDLAPTMLDYARVEIPKSMQGASLRPWLRG